MSDTVTEPPSHRGTNPRGHGDLQRLERLLSTESSLELIRPQASNHLGFPAQGSRWLPRGQGPGLCCWGLSGGGGPRTMCLGERGPVKVVDPRGQWDGTHPGFIS